MCECDSFCVLCSEHLLAATGAAARGAENKLRSERLLVGGRLKRYERGINTLNESEAAQWRERIHTLLDVM